ncbi:tetratricopeptide repeat protein 12-like [Macrosteles quadrilineatus]|uniref:tetratricopeptide repeat protein 12-like n=1 Tax=Macrosteles quadrilineatus TaxID=74068 RepID=UPI0023E0B137|nr:tetratricopeptide repeat protein 12-like [Macrosteles quadrilineatus]
MSEFMNKYETKSSALDEEFGNFMVKVEEVKRLMEGLTSKDKSIAKDTLNMVDNYLGNPDKLLEEINEDSLRVKTNKTVINQRAFDEMTTDLQTQSPEAFMKSCEEDAKRRAEERRLSKESSDTLKKQGEKAFKSGEFEKALSFYNKAIDEFRQSAHLYLCRALTCLKLRLFKKTIEDCDLVIRCFDEKSLKALLYKAKAHKALGEEDIARECVQKAIENHPKSEEDIVEYVEG